MNIHAALLLCSPSPANELAGKLFQASVTFYSICDSETEFEERIRAYLDNEQWELVELQESGVTTRDNLLRADKQEVLDSLERHGEFAMILGKVGSDN